MPSLYLLWVLGADAVALIRGENAYRARPWYKWLLFAGLLVVSMWVGFTLTQGGTIFGFGPN